MGMVDCFLWRIANELGSDVANGMIRKYDLDLFANGGHKWFLDEKTEGLFEPLRYPDDLFGPDGRKCPTKNAIKNFDAFIVGNSNILDDKTREEINE